MQLLALLPLLLSRLVVSDSLRPHGPQQAPFSVEFYMQEYWSGLPFSSRGLNPHLLLSWSESGFCTTEPPGKAIGNEKLNSIHQVCMELQALCGARGIPRKMIWSRSLSSWIVLILNMIIVPTECYCGKWTRCSGNTLWGEIGAMAKSPGQGAFPPYPAPLNTPPVHLQFIFVPIPSPRQPLTYFLAL